LAATAGGAGVVPGGPTALAFAMPKHAGIAAPAGNAPPPADLTALPLPAAEPFTPAGPAAEPTIAATAFAASPVPANAVELVLPDTQQKSGAMWPLSFREAGASAAEPLNDIGEWRFVVVKDNTVAGWPAPASAAAAVAADRPLGLPGPEAGSGAPSAPAAAMAEQVAAAIQAQAGGMQPGTQTILHLHLEPPQLGPVSIHLMAMVQGVSARLTVQGETARHLVESEILVLRQRLQDGGVTLGRLNVATENGGSRGQQHWEQPEPVFTGATGRAPQPGPVQEQAADPTARINVIA
jgi:hypothetical protein